jgi:anion transporter
VTLRISRDVDLLRHLGLLVAAGVLLTGLVAPVSVVDYRVQAVLSVFLATIVLWITKPVPYAISSLFCVILLYALGLADTFQAAVSGFASSLVFFFFLLLLVGQSVSKVDLDSWVADRLAFETSTPRRSIRRLGTALLALAFLMPSGLARTVTFMPVIDQINDTYDLADDSNFRRLAYYLIGHVNPLASLVVMTGGGMPITTSEIINSTVRPFTWLDWVVYMAPPVVLLYTGAVLVASVVYRVSDAVDGSRSETASASGSENTVQSNGGAVDPLTRAQKVVVGALLTAIVLWIVGSFVGVPAIVPAMAVVFVFSLPGVRIITVDDIASVNWGIVFLMGAMLSLLDVMQELGAFEVVIDAMSSSATVFQAGLVTMFVLFCFAVLVRSCFASVSAALVLLLPVLLEFASALELDQLYVSLSLPIILGAAVFVPFNVPTVLIAYERGPLTRTEVVGLGMMTLVLAFLVVGFGWFVYWPTLEGVLGGAV